MVKPVRLQLSRKKGFRLQELSRKTNGLLAVNVSRPGKFGNPFRIHRTQHGTWEVRVPLGKYPYPFDTYRRNYGTRDLAIADAILAHKRWLRSPAGCEIAQLARETFKDHNAACWCKGPCHGDNLLACARGNR